MNSGVVVLSKSLPGTLLLIGSVAPIPHLVFSVGCYGTRSRGSRRSVKRRIAPVFVSSISPVIVTAVDSDVALWRRRSRFIGGTAIVTLPGV